MKIVSIVGARPQFIKAAVMVQVVKGAAHLQHVVVHTGQHYDDNMSQVFFEELDIAKPDYYLGIGSASHGAQTGRMLQAIESLALQLMPESVLVYGDTNSTLAGALAAAKLHIPVAHVEAGLRSFNRQMPEEINRVLTDHAADLLFAPTAAATENLQREGIPEEKVFLSGDVMYDAALYFGARAAARSRILERLHLEPKKYVLATIHRAENTDDAQRLRNIFEALAWVAREIPVVVPLHPRTRNAVKDEPWFRDAASRVGAIEPVGYLDMVMLEKYSRLIATDSGGVQKEAFFHRVPCVTLRGETEWVELVQLGWNRLVPPLSAPAILQGIMNALDRYGADASPYGNGDAAQKILEAITAWHESRR